MALLELLLESLEVFGALLPVFELLLEGLAFELVHDSFGSLPLHANAIKGLRLHARSPPNTDVSAYADMVLRVSTWAIIAARQGSDKGKTPHHDRGISRALAIG